MAIPYSAPVGDGDRRSRRRRDTIEEALDHAVAIMAEQGVGGLTVSEMARRMGVRPPSLYKYFSSLHAVYDALFARGVAASEAAVTAALGDLPPGVERLRAGGRAVVEWAVEHPALAQLMYWRPVPGFAPAPETFAASVAASERARDEVAAAVRRGELSPAADSDEALRLLTVVMSGLISQQLANQPGARFAEGVFSRLTDEALSLWLDRYRT